MQTKASFAVVVLATLAIAGVYTKPTDYTSCPSDQIVNCLVDPCSISSCPGDSKATCISNYCGGCNAIWLTPYGRPAQCKVKTRCPPNQLVNCLVDPCGVSSCPGDLKATCIFDYCGGCNAIWLTPYGRPAQCKVKTICPHGQPEVQCAKDPCLGQICSNYPNAVCVANYCGGCNFDWYKPNGEKVTCDNSI